jgi:hypothetical protein
MAGPCPPPAWSRSRSSKERRQRKLEGGRLKSELNSQHQRDHCRQRHSPPSPQRVLNCSTCHVQELEQHKLPSNFRFIVTSRTLLDIHNTLNGVKLLSISSCPSAESWFSWKYNTKHMFVRIFLDKSKDFERRVHVSFSVYAQENNYNEHQIAKILHAHGIVQHGLADRGSSFI